MDRNILILNRGLDDETYINDLEELLYQFDKKNPFFIPTKTLLEYYFAGHSETKTAKFFGLEYEQVRERFEKLYQYALLEW